VSESAGPRVALVHDWLTGMRGGEKVLDAICEVFPQAPLFTLLRVPGTVSRRIESRPLRTSFVQALPRPGRFYRHYLPLYPLAVRQFDFSSYDLVISSSHCAVKSVMVPPGAVHVCYCHSPMRYAWDQFNAYFGPAQAGSAASRLLTPVMRAMARWDQATSSRVDRFLANSQYVAGRIRRYYNRRSTIVYPPVDTEFYTPHGRASSPAFLIVSALVPYKRLEVAIEACRQLRAPLKIVGTGPEKDRLAAIAGPEVEFLGWTSDERIRELYRTTAATLLPGTEDFGIAPVEAQACGAPVVALNSGGARETVIHGRTGLLVDDPSPAAFAEALQQAAATTFDAAAIRANAERFSRAAFIEAFTRAVAEAIHDKSIGGNADAARWGAEPPRSSIEPWPPLAREVVLDPDAAGMPEAVQTADPRDAARWPPAVPEADPENKQ
jgi:glycosyltransferase involved in cell wall biosynthesis